MAMNPLLTLTLSSPSGAATVGTGASLTESTIMTPLSAVAIWNGIEHRWIPTSSTDFRARRLTAVQIRPACAQRLHSGFRPPVTGEHTLLVSVHAQYRRSGVEVGEVPHVFADELRDAIEHSVMHVQKIHLELFGPRS